MAISDAEAGEVGNVIVVMVVELEPTIRTHAINKTPPHHASDVDVCPTSPHVASDRAADEMRLDPTSVKKI